MLITLVVVGLSAGAGWALERWLLVSLAPAAGVGSLTAVSSPGPWPPFAAPGAGWWGGVPLAITLLALASALAGRSLEQAVEQVLIALPDAGEAVTAMARPGAEPGDAQRPDHAGDGPLTVARQRLSWIVGRDTDQLDAAGILRAAAETASENAVDGLFAPLFWMLVGAVLWQCPGAPGPLSLAWMFKAASTLDSMLGYRRGTLRWLGTAGARLDDALTWLPCRLVAFTLPLVSGRPGRWVRLGRLALRQGAADPSPNAGVSQASHALLLGLQLGGESRYAGEPRFKPLVGLRGALADARPIGAAQVRAMLRLDRRLQILWLALVGVACAVSSITKTLS